MKRWLGTDPYQGFWKGTRTCVMISGRQLLAMRYGCTYQMIYVYVSTPDILLRFLLAQLYMDSLATKCTRRDIRDVLSALPKGLDEIYDQAMQRVDSQNEDHRALAQRVLSWVSHALEPLSVNALREALAVQPGDTSLDEDKLPDEDTLVSVCAGLVVIDRRSNIIRLVHFTTQKYFDDVRTSQFASATAEIAEICI